LLSICIFANDTSQQKRIFVQKLANKTLILMKKYKIISVDKTPSTNTYLQQLAQQKNLDSYTCVRAIEQTQGKGQGEHKWISGVGENLTFSIFLKLNNLHSEKLFIINKCVALTVIDLLKKHMPLCHISIKWPNDIIVNNGKIAGILIENLFFNNTISSIIGIGININETTFPHFHIQAVSLKCLTQKHYDLEKLLQTFMSSFVKKTTQLTQQNIKKIENEYDNHLLFYKEYKSFFINEQRIVGQIIGVDSMGKLIFQHKTNSKIETFEHGEIVYCLQCGSITF
jgi:BirA family transcriptional regulator, biotin operon repressor / biotin---[acetyl-CoA-carboxylase] ligase